MGDLQVLLVPLLLLQLLLLLMMMMMMIASANGRLSCVRERGACSKAYVAVHWLAVSSVCFNPFAYCWLNASFRETLRVTCRHCSTLPRLRRHTHHLAHRPRHQSLDSADQHVIPAAAAARCHLNNTGRWPTRRSWIIAAVNARISMAIFHFIAERRRKV